MKRLADQALLAGIAVHEPDKFVRAAAVSKLGNPSLVKEIAQNDPDEFVRRAAGGDVSTARDPDVEFEIMMNTDNEKDDSDPYW